MSDKYTVGRQPCSNLRRGPCDIPSAPDLPNVHQCPPCGGWRTWCVNCCHDHHADGWETCKPPAEDAQGDEDD